MKDRELDEEDQMILEETKKIKNRLIELKSMKIESMHSDQRDALTKELDELNKRLSKFLRIQLVKTFGEENVEQILGQISTALQIPIECLKGGDVSTKESPFSFKD